MLVAAQPTRGVDSARATTSTRGFARPPQAGAGVLVLSADLDELRALCNRILVLVARSDRRRSAADDLGRGARTPDARRGRRRERPPWSGRRELTSSRSLPAAVAGLAVGWIAFCALVWLYGASPRAMAGLVFEGTWGTSYGAGQVLFKATPLLFTGIAVDLALRAGLFNIGAEGQLAVGSLAAGVVGAHLPAGHAVRSSRCRSRSPRAMAAGALWALVPALLKGRFGAHEVISTIMMNRIADSAVGLALGAGGLALTGTVRTADVVARRAHAAPRDVVPCAQGQRRELRARSSAVRRARSS